MNLGLFFVLENYPKNGSGLGGLNLFEGAFASILWYLVRVIKDSLVVAGNIKFHQVQRRV